MKNILSLLCGVTVILVVGFSFVKWQTNQNDSDRVRQAMTTAIQKSSTKSEDMSQRINNSDVKTMRLKSLKAFVDTYFDLYNSNVYVKNKQTPNNTKFNFYLSNAKDLKSVSDADVSHGVSVVVANDEIKSLAYTTTGNKQKNITGNDVNRVLTMNVPVDVKMVKVHAVTKNETFDATAALSVKRSPVASPVSNKLETLTVPYDTRADDNAFLKDIDIRNGIGVKIEISKIKFHLETLDSKTVAPETKLTNEEYKAVYEAVDEDSGSKLKIGRKILVDQNLPLIETPDVVNAYVGDSEFIQARAFEMPNGESGERGREITSSLTQNLTKDQLNKAGTYTQKLVVKDAKDKENTKTRTLVLKPNTPEFEVAADNIGTYSINRMPAYSELMAGVTAKSPKDGDLTTSIKMDTSDVNASKAGTYNVKYSVIAPTGGLSKIIVRTITFQ